MVEITVTPTVDQLDRFLEREIVIWGDSSADTSRRYRPPVHHPPFHTKTLATQSSSPIECPLCKGQHKIFDCDIFLSSNSRDRLARNARMCVVRLQPPYYYKRCTNTSIKCSVCNRYHHTLIHSFLRPSMTNTLMTEDFETHHTILPTAVTIVTRQGIQAPIRCPIYLCAEHSYICETLVQRLGLEKRLTNVIIKCNSGLSGTVSSMVEFSLQLDTHTTIQVEALVVPKITGPLATNQSKSQNHRPYKISNLLTQ